MNRGAFGLILNSKNEVLLVRSLTHEEYDDHWTLSGGIVETGETFEQGLKREIFEEVGLECEVGEELSDITSIAANIRAVTYKAFYVSGDLRLQTDEIADARWFSLQEAKKLKLGFNIRDLIEAYSKDVENSELAVSV